MKILLAQPYSGDRFIKAEHEGHLLAFVEISSREGETQHGHTRWAQCEWVIDLTTNQVLTDVPVFGTALAPALFGSGARVVIGRLVKGRVTTAGRNPPWLLEAATSEDRETVQAWVDAHVTELPSGKLIVDEDAVIGTSSF